MSITITAKRNNFFSVLFLLVSFFAFVVLVSHFAQDSFTEFFLALKTFSEFLLQQNIRSDDGSNR